MNLVQRRIACGSQVTGPRALLTGCRSLLGACRNRKSQEAGETTKGNNYADSWSHATIILVQLLVDLESRTLIPRQSGLFSTLFLRTKARAMKILCAVMLSLVVAITPLSAEQEPQVDIQQLLQDFAREGSSSDVAMRIIHLNDVTTDALFDPPQKFVLRAQARAQTMFFVTGIALQDTEIDFDFQLLETAALGQHTYRLFSTSIANMETGTQLSEGDEFSGIFSLEQLLPLRSRMVLVQGNFLRFEWEFAPNVLRQLEAAAQ